MIGLFGELATAFLLVLKTLFIHLFYLKLVYTGSPPFSSLVYIHTYIHTCIHLVFVTAGYSLVPNRRPPPAN